MHKLRLAFMGTPDFAVPVLQALKDAGHDIAVVILLERLLGDALLDQATRRPCGS